MFCSENPVDRGAWGYSPQVLPNWNNLVILAHFCLGTHTQEDRATKNTQIPFMDFEFSSIFKLQFANLEAQPLWKGSWKSTFSEEQLTELRKCQELHWQEVSLFFSIVGEWKSQLHSSWKICKQMWFFQHITVPSPASVASHKQLLPFRRKHNQSPAWSHYFTTEFSVIYFLNSWFKPRTCIKCKIAKQLLPFLHWIYLNIGVKPQAGFVDYQHC